MCVTAMFVAYILMKIFHVEDSKVIHCLTFPYYCKTHYLRLAFHSDNSPDLARKTGVIKFKVEVYSPLV